MGGIIRGFIGGAGKAMSDVGKMMLGEKLQSERDEANALRDAELRRTLKAEDREFATSEREAGQKFAAGESAKREAGAKERALIGAGKTRNPQLIKYTDSKGFEQQGVLKDMGGGKYSIVKPDTGEPVEENISTEELKNMAAKMTTESGKGEDWIPWNEYGYKDPEVRAAVAAEKAKPETAPKPKPGIVSEKMRDKDTGEVTGEVEKSFTQVSGGGESKQIGTRTITKQQYIDAMVSQHGKDKLKQIEAQWASY